MSTTARITAVCQKASYGVQKPHFQGNKALTKSAQHLKFDARDLGITIQKDDPQDAKKKKEAKQMPTTFAYKATISIEDAIRFLNKVDQSTKTVDYMKKAAAYNEQKAIVLKAIDPNDLEGAGRLKYWNALKAFSFTFYTVKYTIVIEDEQSNKRVTESRTHYRTARLTEQEFLRSLNIKATPDDEPDEESASVEEEGSESGQNLEEMNVEEGTSEEETSNTTSD